MTTDEQKELDRQRRLAGQGIIEEQSRRQVRTFLDELRHRTSLYRTVASLGDQVAQEYRGRAVMELLQNAHDVLGDGGGGDRRQVTFVLNSSSEQPELLIANSGRPFRREDFSGICQLAQSPKNPKKSVGNKGLGFRSVLELTTRPEIWSTAPAEADIAFTFGFDPDVLEPIAQVAKQLLDGDAPTDWAFGPAPVLHWSDRQFDEYRTSLLSQDGIERVDEAREWLSNEVNKYLSPYVLPRFLGDPPPQVARLLDNGHVTVIRLPLDGGRSGSADEAVESVRKQLQALDEAAMVFLPHLSVLRREIDEEVVELERKIVAEGTLPAFRKESDNGETPGARQRRVRVSRTGPYTTAERSFHIWSRVLGGSDQPEATERIAAAVRHLPNRWPEVEQVEVAVAVEDTREARQGAFVIFLPTRMPTGLGAHVNAPFYGSLDRTKIDFGDEYNELLLEFLMDLVLDAVAGLVKGPAEPWRARAVIDLLAQARGSLPADDPKLMRRLRERARGRDHYSSFEELALILCDDGWRKPGVARTMPNVPGKDPFGEAGWRAQAGFAVASSALDERREAVEVLLLSLGGSPSPTEREWADTLSGMAGWVGASQTEPAWSDFLHSALDILPRELISEPADADADPLRTARFLPTSDARLLSPSDEAQVFFRPHRGTDDAADFVGSVPGSLKQRIAFLHHDVKTHEGSKRERTKIQKFLDGRFVQSFRREDLIRGVIVKSLPELPAEHGSPEAAVCADALAWTLEVIGHEQPEGLLDQLAKLPVACTDGWFPMREAVFGPGWADRCGEHLVTLADRLPREEGQKLLRNALLPPGDERWFPQRDERRTTVGNPQGTDLADHSNLFARAGVVDGLRLEGCDTRPFWMTRSDPKLPPEAPVSVPQSAWEEWIEAVRGEVKPEYTQELKYELKGVKELPSLHRKDLGDSARRALSVLILTSLAQWKDGWAETTINLLRPPWRWSQRITSPLKHWLSTLPWLDDTPSGDQGLLRDPRPLHQRWFVPASLLRSYSGQFRHLSPLSLPLAQRLGEDEDLLGALETLGLNVYPTEDALTGPALLETLADVAERLTDGADVRNAMPAGGFNVLLGQVRHGWRHFDPERDLPTRFIIRTKPRRLAVRTPEQLEDVYLPGHGWRTRLLREHGQPIVAMRPQEAAGPVGDRLVERGARRATGLEEHCRIDHRPSTQAADGTQTLDAASLSWLPVVLLALHAHGGGNPAGPATKAWRKAAGRLRRARVRQCRTIEVELQDAGQPVARSKPRAHWLSRDRILVLHRDIPQHGSFEEIAAAAQAILDRQDLLKDLRLVLGALHGRLQPRGSEIEAALDRAEIDAVAFDNIRHLWDGDPSTLVHRIRPVLKLLRVSDDGLDAVATDTAGLTEWLSKNARIPEWPTENLLVAAQECYDDFGMGYRTWRVLGCAAELPAWNEALRALGGKYEQITNAHAKAQARRHLDEAAPLLRVFARHVATADASVPIKDQGELFAKINAVHEGIEKNDEWTRLCIRWSEDWWEVPFGAVLAVLRARYEGISRARPHLGVFEGVTRIGKLRRELELHNATLDPDPLEVARRNQYRLNRAVRRMRELYEAWLEKKGAEPALDATAPEALDDSMYLRDWPEDDLFERATLAVADSEFHAAGAGCKTIEEMRELLGLSNVVVPNGGSSKPKPETRDVAGKPEPINGSDDNYRDIFERLKTLPDQPRGPDAHLDDITSLSDPSPDPVDPKPQNDNTEVGRRRGKTSHLHGSPHLPELVGIIGEMHAYRFLRAKFGIDASAWVSEIRPRVVPLLDSEEDVVSDSHGYDFRFTYKHVTWCVEVKATTGDGTSFDLPASELNAASRIAPRKDERWRILRVRRALDKRPECDWLPNPFEPGGGERLRLRQGGVTVEYERSENNGNHGTARDG